MSVDVDRDLNATVVAVTGASSGIGQAAARALVESGARVAVLARRKERLDELVELLGTDSVHAVVGDVCRPEDNEKLIAQAIERFGRLDSVVANAGVGMYGGILDGTDDELRNMVDVNLNGTIWTVRAAVRHMVGERGGDVVIVSSVAGFRGGSNEAVYAATKFGQIGLAGSIDRELRESGIRVSVIAPAAVATEFAIGRGRTENMPWLAEVMRPEDVAAAIVAVLRQPRRLRTQTWSMWSMVEGS